MGLECCGAPGRGPCNTWCMCVECKRVEFDAEVWEMVVRPFCGKLLRWGILGGLLVWQMWSAFA